MSRAIQGLAELGGAVAIGGISFLLASTGVGFAALPYLTYAMYALAAGGIAMEAGALASALTANRGMNITTRQPAAQRQVVYGPQRVGGIEIYPSTTGSSKRQYNKVIVLSGHQMAGIEALYLDGRRVWFDTSSGGSRTYNGFTFGGNANGNTYTGPNGQRYNFGGLVYCEMRDGTQVSGDIITGLTANDPAWNTTGAGNPYVGGCCYVYLKVEGDAATFPQEPEVKFTVHGKSCWDPRISAYVPGCSNPALIAADILTDPVYGLGEDWDAVYSGAAGTQLIAAANVCDESVYSPGAGANEARYACGLHYDASTGAGDALVQVMDAMGGRISRIGGQWMIFPAYWQGPAFNFDSSMLTAEVSWQPTRKFRELNNRVRGTYTSPNFPYNIAGNAYDRNGFDSDGNAQNNFSFAWQPTSIPQYACDPQHGYAADEYLNQDSLVQSTYDPTVTYAAGAIVSYNMTVAGTVYATVYKSNAGGNVGNTPGPASAFWTLASVPLVETVSLPAVLSLGQAQRLLKIKLLRNRMQQGSTSMEMRISALGAQPIDVMNFTWPEQGWTEKPLEISGCSPFRIVPGNDGETPSIRATFQVQETSSDIYEWNPELEELDIYDVPAITPAQAYVVAPPTSMAVISSAATAITAIDGSVTPRAEITWNTPQDAWATQIQSQYRLTGSSTWINGPTVDVALNALYIAGIVAGQQYDFQIRSVRPNGAASVWVQVLGAAAGLTVGTYTQLGLDPAALTSSAYSTGYASIEVWPFTARIGQLSVGILPGGPQLITVDGTLGGAGGSLPQQALYYVYYQDPNLTGGAVTMIATINPADFAGKNGYFCVGSIVTAYQSTSSAPQPIYPTVYSSGARSILNPTSAFDGNFSTYASVLTPLGSHVPAGGSPSQFGTWSGFPPVLSVAGQKLYIDLAATIPGAFNGSVTATATIGGVTSSVAALSAGTSQSLYSLALATGTDLSTIAVTVTTLFASLRPGHAMPSGFSSGIEADVYEIYVQ